MRLNQRATRFEFSVKRRVECRYFIEQRTAVQLEEIVFREKNGMMEFFGFAKKGANSDHLSLSNFSQRRVNAIRVYSES